MKLPNGERADLGTKLEDYSLNFEHRQGQHKARVFEAALGITLANKAALADAILGAAASSTDVQSRGDPAKHFVTGKEIFLRRGQIGTVVMTYDGSAFEVEFAGMDGRAYAILPIPAERLMLLRQQPDFASA